LRPRCEARLSTALFSVPVGDTGRNSRPDDRGDEPLLGWAEASRVLEERLRNEYGSFDGRPFWVWTATRVVFLAEYDGRWRVASVPRSPQPGRPIAIGGDFVDAREEAAG
jgi:hypothetical protein